MYGPLGPSGLLQIHDSCYLIRASNMAKTLEHELQLVRSQKSRLLMQKSL